MRGMIDDVRTCRPRDLVDREAHAVDGDGALRSDESAELVGEARRRRARRHRAGSRETSAPTPSTWPAHDVAAEARVEAEGALEVDARAERERPERGLRERLGRGVGLEPVLRDRVDREAHAVDADRLAEL